jgi:ankyrin repeat protein
MKTVAKVLAMIVSAHTAWAAEYRGLLSSDLEYQNLLTYIEPSPWLHMGNAGQLQLLVMCIERGDAAVLEKLLDAVPRFANVCEAESGCSPAHWAAFKGDTNLLAVLVKHRADLRKKGTNWSISPLHIAKDAVTAGYLLDHGASLEGKAVFGQTPLMWAARRDNTEVIEFLLRRGAKLNARDKDGRTALCFAQEGGRTNAAALLIRKGAVPLSAAEKEKLGSDGVSGSFFTAGREHPFAQAILIFGAPWTTSGGHVSPLPPTLAKPSIPEETK